jgi:hypothetical protein
MTTPYNAVEFSFSRELPGGERMKQRLAEQRLAVQQLAAQQFWHRR